MEMVCGNLLIKGRLGLKYLEVFLALQVFNLHQILQSIHPLELQEITSHFQRQHLDQQLVRRLPQISF